MDGLANSSTVTRGRLSGFGGAPNMGHDPHGRRHATPAWLNMITEPDPMQRGKKAGGADGRNLPGRRETNLR
ncbi:malonate decarboxylase subunit alpha [Klebsiella pneumoniae subsp. pneumoniae]|nr:malonate decarboxylase subunit alpha [Klebsiella pneumoniae subsp. pneumoniae]